MTFRFLHTADLHLDSPLVSLALRDPALAAEVATASRTTLTRIIDLCLSEQVHALIIAGDLWDGSQTSAKTPRFLKQELQRLSDAGIRCFIIRGNHDAASKVTRELDPPPLTHVFGTKAATQSFEAGGQMIAVHGLSFAEGAVPESLLPRYPAPVPGAFNIGMMHTSLNGAQGHDLYAPCAVADLDAHGYDYWALGHIHIRSQHLGRAAVVMPGIPQGRDMGEAGPRSVTLGHFDGKLTLEERFLAPLRFDRVTLDLTGLTDWTELLARLQATLHGAPRTEDHLVLRATLTGATPLAFRIARDLDRLKQEALTLAEGLPGLWIDKLENRTTGEAASALPADLVQIVTADLPADPAVMETLTRLAADVLQDLPPELRDLLGQDEEALKAACDTLLRGGIDRLLPRLSLGEA
ncbi:DNA repair exonuclease [Rhodobacteraceae bacterium CYK-10]|uniref:DNA repair exonuclease n=1 Tax=Stagnihabitans tardus TaxID=2699202 RepID=A0AAE4YAJ7_9RHOB|nr:DNA repair exonuclease [Stagnihabitans tardus]